MTDWSKLIKNLRIMYIKSILTKDSKVLLQQLRANFSIIANSAICQPRFLAEIKVCQPTCRNAQAGFFKLFCIKMGAIMASQLRLKAVDNFIISPVLRHLITSH